MYEVVLKINIFDMFLEKIFNVPLWIKQVIYIKLADYMRENSCKNFIDEHPDDIFSTHVPVLTFKGRNELMNRECGLDNDIYNFLQCCDDGLSIIEISVNTFHSMEEIAKYYELCLEQSFIKASESKELNAMAGFISGKLRIGEYFKQRGTINVDQLQMAILTDRDTVDKKFGEILIQLGYITEKDLKPIISLKEEAKKRFILDYNTVPKTDTEYCNKNQQYEEEINSLKEENSKLKKKLLQLLQMVKKNAGE